MQIPPAPPSGCRAHCGHSYFHQNYSGPGPSMSTVHCPLSPATISTLCRYLCSQLFPRQCKYRADIQLEMWIYWFSSALCCGCCGNLSSFTAGEGRAQAPAWCWCVITLTGIVNTVVMALSKNTANSNHACV